MMEAIEFRELSKQLIGCEAFRGDGNSMGIIISCVPEEIVIGDYKVQIITDTGNGQHIKASVALYDGTTLSFSSYSGWSILVDDKKDSCRKCSSKCKGDKLCGLYDPRVWRK